MSTIIPTIIVGSLIIFYLVFLWWSYTELRARAGDLGLNNTAAPATSGRGFTQLTLSCLVLLVSIAVVVLFMPPASPEEGLGLLIVVLFFQSLWMGVEWYFSRNHVTTRLRQYLVRNVFCFAVCFSLVFWSWSRPTFRMVRPGKFFVTVIGFSVLSIGWSIARIIRRRSARRTAGHLTGGGNVSCPVLLGSLGGEGHQLPVVAVTLEDEARP